MAPNEVSQPSMLSMQRPQQRAGCCLAAVMAAALLLASHLSPTSAQKIPLGEQSALLALKQAWGSSFTGAATWVAGSSCINWEGVYCSVAGSVLQILLAQHGIRGTLPPAIGSFPNLSVLDLSSNALTGAIPATIGQLKRATAIYLSGNQLSGQIPGAIGSLPLLKNLYLNNNQLGGSLPAELGNLLAIDDLRLNFNKIGGIIPPNIGRANSINNLDISNNVLSGEIPWQLGNLNHLQGLWMYNNQLTGYIPWSFRNLTQLLILDVSNNFLSGKLPNMTSNMRANAGMLNFENNYFFGFNLVPVLGSPKCPDNLPAVYRISGNCLVAASWCSIAKFPQKPGPTCRAFCGTLSNATDTETSGQCSGQGICLRSTANKISCRCRRGFVPKPGSPTQCIR